MMKHAPDWVGLSNWLVGVCQVAESLKVSFALSSQATYAKKI